MSIEWRSPYSGVVDEIGYDAEHNEMLVRWRGGSRVSIYADVSWEQFEQTSKAPSVGAAIAADIKPSHLHRYLR